MRYLVALVVMLPLVAAADAPSAEDIAEAKKMLATFAGDVPADVRPRLLYQACSENARCHAGCNKELELAATIENQADRGAILAACEKVDYKARREKGEKISPDAWIEQHWKQVFDQLEKHVARGDQKQWKANRKKARL